MKNITTIFIDVDNTLLDFEKSSIKAMEKVFSDYNLTYKEEYFDIFNQINIHLWQELEKGFLTLDELHEIRWSSILVKLGIKNVDGIAFDADFVRISSKIGVAIDGAVEILEYLSKKYTVCVASNSEFERQLNRLTDCNMMQYIDHLFTSGQLGFYKPNREFFDACFEKVGNISTKNVIMIGDSLTADISGGKNYGVSTCWFNLDKVEKFDKNIADYVITDLLELKNIL